MPSEKTSSRTGRRSELATLQLDGHFVDDGRYVYYDAQIDDGDFRSGISLSSDMLFRVQFEIDGTTYIGFDVTFPEQDILEGFPTDLPGKIRWYRVEIQDTD